MLATRLVEASTVAAPLCSCGTELPPDALVCKACGVLHWPPRDAPRTRAPRVRLTMDVQEPEVRLLMADVYREAAMRGTDMCAASQLLEKCRAALLNSEQPFESWDALDDEVVRAQSPELTAVAESVRSWFERRLLDPERGVYASLAQTDASTHAQAWLCAFAETLTHFRYSAAAVLAQDQSDLGDVPVDLLRRAIDLAAQDRWVETLPAWTYLASRKELPAGTRAHICVSLAEVLWFHFEDEDGAWPHLLEAYRVDPYHERVVSALGDAFVRTGNTEAAKHMAQRTVELAPNAYDGYLLFGDIADKEGDRSEAEKWFLEAMRCAPGNTLPYQRLISLLSGRDQFATSESRILQYAAKCKLAEPMWAYNSALLLGNVYLQNGRIEESRQHYTQARDLSPERPRAFAGIGFCHLASSAYEEAQKCFEEALQRAPEEPEGVEGLVCLYQEQCEWQKLIAASEKHRAAWQQAPFRVLPYVANAIWQLGKRDEAKQLLLDQLQRTPENNLTMKRLEAFAREYCDDKDQGAAESLYQAMHVHRAKRHPAELAVHLGDLYFSADKLDQAAAEYRKAIQLEAGRADYYSKLGDALRQSQDFPGARKAYGQAYELSKAERRWHSDCALVENDEGIAAYRAGDYGTAAEHFRKAVEENSADGIIWLNLADAWEAQLGLKGEAAASQAAAALTEVIRLRPDDQNYKDRLSRIEARRTLGRLIGEAGFRNEPYSDPIAIEAGPALMPFFQDPELQSADDFLTGMLYQDYGLWGLKVQVKPGALADDEYRMLFRGCPVAKSTHPLDRRLVTGAPEELDALPGPSEPGNNPANSVPSRWVSVEVASKIEAAGVEIGPTVAAWSIPGYAYLHLLGLLRRRLEYVFDLETLASMLESAKGDACRKLLENDEAVLDFLHVARLLLSEDVPLSPLDAIVTAFLNSWRPGCELAELVRSIRALPEVRSELRGADPSCVLLPVSQELEDILTARVFPGVPESFLAVEPDVCQNILASVREAVGDLPSPGAIVVRSPKLRILLRRLVRLEYPYLFVIAQEELEAGWESRMGETVEYIDPFPEPLLLRPKNNDRAFRDLKVGDNAEQIVNAWLTVLEETYPRVVAIARQRLPAKELAVALEALSRSGVPVADLASVLDCLVSVRSTIGYAVESLIVFTNGLGLSSQTASAGLSILERTEAARQGMAAAIAYRFAPTGTLSCVLVDPAIELALGDPKQSEDDRVRQRIVVAFREERKLIDDPTCVVVTAIEYRAKLEEILSAGEISFPVVAYQDLAPDLNITPLARASWSL